MRQRFNFVLFTLNIIIMTTLLTSRSVSAIPSKTCGHALYHMGINDCVFEWYMPGNLRPTMIQHRIYQKYNMNNTKYDNTTKHACKIIKTSDSCLGIVLDFLYDIEYDCLLTGFNINLETKMYDIFYNKSGMRATFGTKTLAVDIAGWINVLKETRVKLFKKCEDSAPIYKFQKSEEEFIHPNTSNVGYIQNYTHHLTKLLSGDIIVYFENDRNYEMLIKSARSLPKINGKYLVKIHEFYDPESNFLDRKISVYLVYERSKAYEDMSRVLDVLHILSSKDAYNNTLHQNVHTNDLFNFKSGGLKQSLRGETIVFYILCSLYLYR